MVECYAMTSQDENACDKMGLRANNVRRTQLTSLVRTELNAGPRHSMLSQKTALDEGQLHQAVHHWASSISERAGVVSFDTIVRDRVASVSEIVLPRLVQGTYRLFSVPTSGFESLLFGHRFANFSGTPFRDGCGSKDPFAFDTIQRLLAIDRLFDRFSLGS